MNLEEFKSSLTDNRPPSGLSLALQSLWQDAKGDWDTAHKLAQAQNDQVGAWVHAYLHRWEGDNANAGYWYSRAGRSASSQPLEVEWAEIVAALLK